MRLRQAVVAFAATVIALVAASALAHAHDAIVTCTSASNDFSTSATVHYVNALGSQIGDVTVPAAPSSTSPVTVQHAAPSGTIGYYVTWPDGFRQPAQGLASLPACDATTTTVAATTTTEQTAPHGNASTVASTAASTTTVAPSPSTAVCAAGLLDEGGVCVLPTGVSVTRSTLPRTGGPGARAAVPVALLAIAVGATAVAIARRGTPAE